MARTLIDREARERAIEDAAYAVLSERGYKGASLLVIAKRAKASNETLYAWYGGKAGLFGALVRRNAAAVSDAIDDAVQDGGGALTRLEGVGAALYTLLTSERAVLLNRAAAADVADGGVLGRTLAEEGRGRIAPKLAALVALAQSEGALGGGTANPATITETFLGLLLAEHPVRRIIGSEPPPADGVAEARAASAIRYLMAIYPSERTTKKPAPRAGS